MPVPRSGLLGSPGFYLWLTPECLIQQMLSGPCPCLLQPCFSLPPPVPMQKPGSSMGRLQPWALLKAGQVRASFSAKVLPWCESVDCGVKLP